MKCKKLEDNIIQLAYGELPSPAAEELSKHLDNCDNCRHSYEQHKRTALAIGGLQLAGEPSMSVERLREAILSRQIRNSPTSSWKWAAGSLATGLAAVALAVALSRPTQTGSVIAADTSQPGALAGDVVAPTPSESQTASTHAPLTTMRDTPISETPKAPVAIPEQPRNRKKFVTPRSVRPDVVAIHEFTRLRDAGGFGNEEVIMIQPNPTAEDGTSDALRSHSNVSIGG